MRLGRTRVTFVEQPLYSYIYFSVPVPGRRLNAMTAVMLGSALPQRAQDPGLSETAALLSELGATFRPGKGPSGTWPLVLGGDTVAHVRLNTITQARWRDLTLSIMKLS